MHAEFFPMGWHETPIIERDLDAFPSAPHDHIAERTALAQLAVTLQARTRTRVLATLDI